MNPDTPRQIGKWKVIRLLGQGGMSWVYEVTEPRLGATRALKMLKPAMSHRTGYAGFLREARILASLDDDHLVRIYDFDRDPETGNDYYVMELLSGSDLKQHLRREGPLSPERAALVFDGVLQALGKLHTQTPPIVHRDVKPGNLQLTASGRAKLLDLGIAKVTRKSPDETATENGETLADMFKGTVLYAAPEHLAMEDLAPAADVFSLGLCLYEAIEGRHVYADVDGLPDPTRAHLTYQDAFRFYARLEAVRGELRPAFVRTPDTLRPVISRATRVAARDRFRDANEMRSALLDATRPTHAPIEVAPLPREPSEAQTRLQRADERAARASDRTGQLPIARTRGLSLALVAAVGVAVALWWRSPGPPAESTNRRSRPLPAVSSATPMLRAPTPMPIQPPAPTPTETPPGARHRGASVDPSEQQASAASTRPSPQPARKPSRAAVDSAVRADTPYSPPTNDRLRVTVVPAGPIALVVGMAQRFQATTTPRGETVTFSVVPPAGGAAFSRTGTSLALVPDRPGEYRITVVAGAPERGSSRPVVIIATASGQGPGDARVR